MSDTLPVSDRLLTFAGGYLIAKMLPDDRPITLFTAAPELLAACKEALVLLTKTGRENVPPWQESTLCVLRAAIAAAEGT